MRLTNMLNLSLISIIVFSSLLSVQAEAFAAPAFQQIWERSDKVVAEGKAKRTWLWGPEPGVSRREVYEQAPGAERLVQYFDKSRMEITKPDADKNQRWYVTNGLLTIELVTGRLQKGDNNFEQRVPAAVPVAGDPANSGPTYASFSRSYGTRFSERSGNVTDTINRDGITGNVGAEKANAAKFAKYIQETGHNVPDVFWNWMQKLDEDWLFAMGYPVTEPYWSKFTVAGVEREVLVQLFERRALTYNPANEAAWQIEMGNIGQHYYKWRYGDTPGATATPVPGTPGTTASPTPTPVASPTPTPTTPPVSSNPATQETEMLNLLNTYRTQNGLATLRSDSRLQEAARWLSKDMTDFNYFGHIDSKGRDYPKRLLDFGYSDQPVDENIAAGGLVQEIFEVWKKSPGANAIMLNPGYKAVGIGFASKEGTRYVQYWTATFGGK